MLIRGFFLSRRPGVIEKGGRYFGSQSNEPERRCLELISRNHWRCMGKPFNSRIRLLVEERGQKVWKTFQGRWLVGLGPEEPSLSMPAMARARWVTTGGMFCRVPGANWWYIGATKIRFTAH